MTQECARDAIANGYQGAYAHTLLGLSHLKLKEYPSAELEFLTSLSISPENAEVMGHYAYLLYLGGYRKKARELLLKAIQISPNDSIVLHYKFVFETLSKDFRYREQTLEQYVQSDASEVSKLMKLGYAAQHKLRFREARSYFVQALLLDPTDQHVTEALLYVDIILHPICMPVRLFESVIVKVLAPTVFFLLFLILADLNEPGWLGAWTLFYVGLFIYRGWVALPLCKLYFKIKGRL